MKPHHSATALEIIERYSSGSTGSSSPSGYIRTPLPETGPSILDEVRAWLDRYVCTVEGSDLDLLTLWAAHTHLVNETYTTPRLVIDSPVPGSGKTTVLEHLERLCVHPIQMAAVSSSAMLARVLANGVRTMLIDEADRSLDPNKPGIEDLLAILNSGYKRGGTRPVLTPGKNGEWGVDEMTTFAPVAMAGNNPNLPDDTRSRCIRVLLLPDIEGRVEESDWELIDDDARNLGARLGTWANNVSDSIRTNRPPLPEGVKGRARERWLPLKRVAEAIGGRWPTVVDDLAINDVKRIEAEREEGITAERRHVTLLRNIAEVWCDDETFIPTDDLLARLSAKYSHMWGTASKFEKALTPQGLGRLLSRNYNIHSSRRPGGDRARGYLVDAFQPAFRGDRPPTALIVEFVAASRDEHGVDPICAALRDTAAQIAPSTVRAHLSANKTEAPRTVRDREMLGEIRTVHADNLGVYGARKVHAELRRKDIDVARCTVERLMKADGLQGIPRLKTRRTTRSDGAETPQPADRVGRQFTAEAPNTLWVRT
ncbi:Protein of uncharacterised function (DUF3631) [Gordonia bronchialis]|nr:Protein of uncharacterised function (DUF3631) [Gordonia bronchialis]